MVRGQPREQREAINTPVVNYRGISALNYSMIAKYDKSPADFVNEFIMGIPAEPEDSVALRMGNVIDDVLFTYRGDMEQFDLNFDEKYALYTGVESGKQVFILADEVFKYVDSGLSFEEMFRQAFYKLQNLPTPKYKGKTIDYALDDFEKNAKDYYQTKLDNIGKTVISTGLLDKSTRIAQEALIDENLAEYLDFSRYVDEEYEILTKFPITFKFRTGDGEIEGKCELDMMHIDHGEKTIQPIDGKSTYDNSMFPYNYLKNRYYIQEAWYTLGIGEWAISNGLADYTILPFKFLAMDTSGFRKPLIYSSSETTLRNARQGFTSGGRSYKGVDELVESIVWSSTKNMWGISKKHHLNRSRVDLNF